jgi:hypothetical protein
MMANHQHGRHATDVADAVHDPWDVVARLYLACDGAKMEKGGRKLEFTCHINGPSAFPRH